MKSVLLIAIVAVAMMEEQSSFEV